MSIVAFTAHGREESTDTHLLGWLVTYGETSSGTTTKSRVALPTTTADLRLNALTLARSLPPGSRPRSSACQSRRRPKRACLCFIGPSPPTRGSRDRKSGGATAARASGGTWKASKPNAIGRCGAHHETRGLLRSRSSPPMFTSSWLRRLAVHAPPQWNVRRVDVALQHTKVVFAGPTGEQGGTARCVSFTIHGFLLLLLQSAATSSLGQRCLLWRSVDRTHPSMDGLELMAPRGRGCHPPGHIARQHGREQQGRPRMHISDAPATFHDSSSLLMVL